MLVTFLALFLGTLWKKKRHGYFMQDGVKHSIFFKQDVWRWTSELHIVACNVFRLKPLWRNLQNTVCVQIIPARYSN